jgi:hypothetical protein
MTSIMYRAMPSPLDERAPLAWRRHSVGRRFSNFWSERLIWSA